MLNLQTCYFAFILINLTFGMFSAGRGQEAPEYRLKTAFLYNFAKFTEWPQNAFKDSSAPLIVGLLGEDPFGEEIDLIRGKLVKNRKLAVKRFKKMEDLETCHILFISSSEKERLQDIFNALKDSTVLTIGETDRFIEDGGVIHLRQFQAVL